MKDKKLISNFETQIASKAKQLEAQPNNGVACKKKRLHEILLLYTTASSL